MKTYSPKPDHIERRWFVLDASGQVLGRLATEAAVLLRGKHKPIFAPHMDTGDHVVVINADRVELTGNKARDKIAYRHSGHPGGIKGIRYGDLLQMRPVAAVEKAVRGMLPKNRLGRQMIKKLHVVAGSEHPHAAQKPVQLAVGERPAWNGLPAPKPRTPSGTTAPAPSTREGSAGSAPATKKTTAKKTTAKKTTAKRTTGETRRKPAAKASTSKASTSKKTTASKRSAAKPSTTTKTTAKKTSAKKTSSKKTTAKETEAKD